jgi:hypothetical protein
MNFEKLLAFHLRRSVFLNSIKSASIVEDNENAELWLVYETSTIRQGTWKKSIKEFIWCSATEMFNTYVATTMLREGYVYFPTDGGEVVVSPDGEEYHIHENSCTCLSNDKPCKHIRFSNWHLHYKARVNLIKKNRNFI